MRATGPPVHTGGSVSCVVAQAGLRFHLTLGAACCAQFAANPQTRIAPKQAYRNLTRAQIRCFSVETLTLPAVVAA